VANTVTALDWHELLTTDATDTSFATKHPTGTEPTGDAVIDLNSYGEAREVQESLFLIPFGAGADNTTYDMRVIGWRKVGTGDSTLWVPQLICELSVTLGGIVGVANKLLGTSDRFADTLALNTGIAVLYQGDADAQPALAEVDTMGCAKVEIIWDMTGATSGNCLWALGG
jgi:hypothetical protein